MRRLLGALALLWVGCNTPYYQSCQRDGQCPDGMECFRDLPAAGTGVCTTTCNSTADCTGSHGERSFCTNAQRCATSCDTDRDCRHDSRCMPVSDLVIAAGICAPPQDGGM